MVQGNVALITGASKGIGKAIAIEFARAGVQVFLVARNEKLLAQAKEEIEREGGKAAYFTADLEEPGTVGQAVDECVRVYGKIDYLVNNAAYTKAGRLEEITKEDFDRHLYLNAYIPLEFMQKTLPYLKESKSAYIINIGSIVSFDPYENQGAYAASKHVVKAFTKLAQREFFDYDIRATILSPGAVATELIATMRPDLTDTSMFSKPEELAKIARFLIENRNNSAIDGIVVRRYSKKP